MLYVLRTKQTNLIVKEMTQIFYGFTKKVLDICCENIYTVYRKLKGKITT